MEADFPVGNSPLIEVEGIYAKLECINPCGSIKDRMVKYVIDSSEAKGYLKPGMKIIEATSGNTGISLAYYASKKGYDVTIIMPENMTQERKDIITGLGANLILSSKEGSFAEAARIRDRMAKKPGYFNPDQFSNPLNTECHRLTTGREILDKIADIDAFVAGVGTGGSLIGVAQALKEIYPGCYIVAVEPSESAVMSGGRPGQHGIYGIGDGFIPALASDGNGGIHPLIDEVICIPSQDAKAEAARIGDEHGYCVGISAGANFLVAKMLRKRYKKVVTVFADSYSRYTSEGLKHCGDDCCEFEKNKTNALKIIHPSSQSRC